VTDTHVGVQEETFTSLSQENSNCLLTFE